MKIRLPADTRYFERCGDSDTLLIVGRVIGKDAEITIDTKITRLSLHDQYQDTVAFRLSGKEFYFIVSDIRIFGLPERLRRLSKFTVVK